MPGVSLDARSAFEMTSFWAAQPANTPIAIAIAAVRPCLMLIWDDLNFRPPDSDYFFWGGSTEMASASV